MKGNNVVTDVDVGYVFAGLSNVSSRLLRHGLSDYSKELLAAAAAEEEAVDVSTTSFFPSAASKAKGGGGSSSDSGRGGRQGLVDRMRYKKDLEHVRAQLRAERQRRSDDAIDHAEAIAKLERRVEEERAKRVAEYELVWLSTQQQLGAERQARALVEAELDVAREQLRRLSAPERARVAEAAIAVDMAKQLSAWFRLTDDETGMTFFQNATTGRTAWELPEGGRAVDVKLSSSNAEETHGGGLSIAGLGRAMVSSSVAAVTSLPSHVELADATDRRHDEWVELFDPRSGDPYYENSRTGETAWTRPPQRSVAARVRFPQTAAAAESAKKTKGTGEQMVRFYRDAPGALGVRLGYDHEGDRVVVVDVRDSHGCVVRAGDVFLGFRAHYSLCRAPFAPFSVLDSTGDGRLSAADLGRVFAAEAARKEADSVFALVTRNLDGRVLLAEFKAMTRSLCYGGQLEALKSSLLSAAARALQDEAHPIVLEFSRTMQSADDDGEEGPQTRRGRGGSAGAASSGSGGPHAQSSTGAGAGAAGATAASSTAITVRSYAPIAVPPRAPFPCANNVLITVRVELSDVKELRGKSGEVAELSLSMTVGTTGELAIKCEPSEVFVDNESGSIEWAPRVIQLGKIRSIACKARRELGDFPAAWPPVDVPEMVAALDAPLLIKIQNVATGRELACVPTTLSWLWSGTGTSLQKSTTSGTVLRIFASSITLGELLILPSGDTSGGRMAGTALAQSLFDLYDQDGSDEIDQAEIEEHLRSTLTALVSIEGITSEAMMAFETGTVVELATSREVRTDPTSTQTIVTIAKWVQEMIFHAADLDRGNSVSSDEFLRWFVPRHAVSTSSWAGSATVVPPHVWSALSKAADSSVDIKS